MSLDDIDRVLSEAAIPRENIDMGQNAVSVPKDSYCIDRFVNPQKVLAFHEAGETIIFRGAHNWFPKLMALCNDLSFFFHCRAQANLYLTPAHTQSSYPHWDSHDIFVLQLAGRKTWKLHEDRLPMPLPRYEFAPGRYEVGPENGAMTFSAGDFAYVPRGLIHNPVADAYSIHVAVGLPVVTWVELLEAMVARCGDAKAPLRQALPAVIGEDHFDLEKVARQFAELAALAMDKERLPALLQELTGRVLGRRRPSVRHRLANFIAPMELGPDTTIKVRPDVRISLEKRPAAIAVSFNDTELEFPESLEPELRNVLDRRRLKVREVSPHLDCGTAIAESLLQHGCIEVIALDGNRAHG